MYVICVSCNEIQLVTDIRETVSIGCGAGHVFKTNAIKAKRDTNSHRLKIQLRHRSVLYSSTLLQWLTIIFFMGIHKILN